MWICRSIWIIWILKPSDYLIQIRMFLIRGIYECIFHELMRYLFCIFSWYCPIARLRGGFPISWISKSEALLEGMLKLNFKENRIRLMTEDIERFRQQNCTHESSFNENAFQYSSYRRIYPVMGLPSHGFTQSSLPSWQQLLLSSFNAFI
jgi:hypothetical protein